MLDLEGIEEGQGLWAAPVGGSPAAAGVCLHCGHGSAHVVGDGGPQEQAACV